MTRPALLDYSGRWWMRLFLGIFFFVLYAPVAALVALVLTIRAAISFGAVLAQNTMPRRRLTSRWWMPLSIL